MSTSSPFTWNLATKTATSRSFFLGLQHFWIHNVDSFSLCTLEKQYHQVKNIGHAKQHHIQLSMCENKDSQVKASDFQHLFLRFVDDYYKAELDRKLLASQNESQIAFSTGQENLRYNFHLSSMISAYQCACNDMTFYAFKNYSGAVIEFIELVRV